MITLRMTRTVDGSLNGRDVTTYQAGETYALPDQGPGGLADVFLREGWAVEDSPVVAELATDSLTPRRCQARTNRGAQCERDAVDGSDYCSVPAHARRSRA